MSTQESSWKATTCYFGGVVKEGQVIAIATYVDRRRICFLLNGETIGQWVSEEALYGLAPSSQVQKEAVSPSVSFLKVEKTAQKEAVSPSVSFLKVEKTAQEEAKDDVNILAKIVENHKEIVVSKSVDITKISMLLQTIISGFEFGAKLVVDAVVVPDKKVLSLLASIPSLLTIVKDKIFNFVNEVWNRYWKERVLTTLIKGEKVHFHTSHKIVDQLRIDYPGETNRELAERIVFEKAVYTSITGLLQGLMRKYSGKLPEAIGDFLAGKKGFEVLHQLLNNHLVNFFDANSLLVEMIYQISLIYGLKSGEGDALVILATAFTKQVAEGLEMNFLINLSSDMAVITPLVPALKNMVAFMLVGDIAINYYEAQKETGKMPIGSLEALLSLEERAFAYLTETSSKGPELEQALANAISVEAVAVPELLSATS
jgi:hypothetical protein